MRKMFERELGGLPKEERERLMKVMNENPGLFSKMGASISEKIKNGVDKMSAARLVAEEFKTELSNLMK